LEDQETSVTWGRETGVNKYSHESFAGSTKTAWPSLGWAARKQILTGSVASPRFVARRGKNGNYVMGHSRWTSGRGRVQQLLDDKWFCDNAVLIERDVSCWHLHRLISQTTQ